MNKFDDSDDRLQDLEQLADFAREFSSIDEFLSDVALSEGFRSERFGIGEEEDDDYLILSTIHQAKGLEWPAVFVIGLIEGQFPHSKSLNRDEDLEEERRLFYVAVTRAKDELYLTYPQTSFYGSGMGRTLTGPSRFVLELPRTTYEPWQVDNYNEAIIDLEDL
jgi:DNA helicase-2/ATP-dependent DNA helicase PcrA